MRFRNLAIAFLGLTLAGAAWADEKLSVGDAAPGLDIEKWVKGDETTIESGKTYVVEFWATWCGPCKRSIPHLTKLQEEYEDTLTIIGVSDEELGVVEKFVKGQGSKMDYTVVVDRQQGTKRAWFDAAHLQGIPAAFVVDQKGKIAFIGNPLDPEFDTVLKNVVSGRYDPKLQKEAGPMLSAARNARKVRNWRLASKHYNDIIELDPSIFATAALEQFEMMLVDMGEKDKAYGYARTELINGHFASDAEALQWLAQKIAADPKIEKDLRDMDVAMEAARAARKVAEPNDPAAMAVVAEIHFHRGEIDQAIALQKEAWMIAPEKKKPAYRRSLTTYQEAHQRVSSIKSTP